jgi:transcriptional regulator with XRE-family HTH domain
VQTSAAQRIAGEVRAELARQRRSQASLALALGISQQALSRRMTGDIPFNIDQLSTVASFLSMPLEALVSSPVQAAS